jgi:hypothetical protein
MKKNQLAGVNLKRPIRLAKRFLPKNRWGDHIVSLLNFFQFHARLPKKVGGDLSDALFSIKASNEILDPLRVFVSDKHYVKLFVKATIGDLYNVPTNAVLGSYEEALSYEYPKDCVIKPTHMSGEVMFRKNGSDLDFTKIARWFESNYYTRYREANYKSLKPKLIIEPYIFGGESCEDYKIFCVNGEPRLIWVDFDRQSDHRRNLYTTDWELLPVSVNFEQGHNVPRPVNLKEMLRVARELSCDFSFIRVDLYSSGKEVLVGELTNCSGNANEKIMPAENASIVTDLLFGPEREGASYAHFRPVAE